MYGFTISNNIYLCQEKEKSSYCNEDFFCKELRDIIFKSSISKKDNNSFNFMINNF